MRLNSLHMVNFRQHAETRLEFDLGLTGIIGPNGSGKTTILEAIAWALYGQAAARGNRESIRHIRAGGRSPVRVELDFSLAGHRYRVERGLTNAEVYLDGAATPIANTITGVGELLQRRLGMTRAEFFNTFFTGQKELNVMAAMGPSERAQFLSRVLGYEKLRAAQNIARERRRVIAAEANGLRMAMPDPEAVERALAAAGERVAAARVRASEAAERRRASDAALAALAPRWERAQREREKLQQVMTALQVVESEEAALARDRLRVERELAALAGARAELDRIQLALAPLPEVTAEFARLEALAREEGRRQTLLDGQRVVAEDLARLRDRRVRIESAPALEKKVGDELAAKRASLEEIQQRLEARRTEWVRDRQEAETKHESAVATLRELAEQRERLLAAGASGKCPTCAQPLGRNYQTVLDDLNDKIDTIRVDDGYFVARVAQLKHAPEEVKRLDESRLRATQEHSALERKLAKVQAAIQELAQLDRDIAAKERRAETIARDLESIPAGYDAARHAELRREVQRLTPLSERAARLGAQLDREPQLHDELARIEHATSELAERAAKLHERRAKVALSEEEFAALRETYERAAAEARAAEVGAASARGEEDAARGALESAEAARRELHRTQETLKALQRDRRLHDELDRAYSEFRTELNMTLRPELSEIASSFLTDLTDARYSELSLDDNYNIVVLEDGVAKPVISGGEEDLANLVLRLAISQMIAERAGQSFSLLVLDEVFGSLDELRRHNVVDLLRRLQDRFEQVILITHIESVREELDRVISVRYDEERGTSVAEYTRGGPDAPPPEAVGDVDLEEVRAVG